MDLPIYWNAITTEHDGDQVDLPVLERLPQVLILIAFTVGASGVIVQL